MTVTPYQRRQQLKNQPQPVRCEFCGAPTSMEGTKLCNNCWEVKGRLPEFLQHVKGRAFALDLLARMAEREAYL